MTIRILLILLLCLQPAVVFPDQEGRVPQEYQVKAKYLLNMPLYIDLPPEAQKGPAYTICLIGETPLEDILALSKGRLLKNRPLAILKVNDLSQIDNCQMLFIASSERHRLQTLLSEAHRHRIVTVSDMRDFARLGGMISLQTVENRITFDINRSAAVKSSIRFSSHLLKLARDVIN